MQRVREFLRGPFGILVVLAGLAILAGIFLRFYNLSFPDKQVFDEVYFPVFANKYLTGTDFYDVHPPLGKLIIALGILLFGNEPFGWRIVPALIGTATIPLMAYLYWLLMKDKVGVVLMAMFVAIDGLFIIYSRTSLMDGILFFFIFLSLVAAMRLRPMSTGIGAGIVLGLAIAIKWPAAAILLPMAWFAKKNGKLKQLLWALPFTAITYLVVVYIGQVLIGAETPLYASLHWNLDALQYHLSIKDTHPWGSQWWTWPIPLRPVLFLYDSVDQGRIAMETAMGNPLLWIMSTISVLGTVVTGIYQVFWKKVNITTHPLFPMMLGFLAFWLPWVGVSRVVFLYHYFPSYGFALVMLIYWLSYWWKRVPYVVIGFLVLVCIVAGLYMPWSVGWITLSESWIRHLVIVNSWLY